MSRHHRRLDPKRWARVRRLVFDRDGWRCRSCGRAGRLECDHIQPLEDGGAEFDPANLQSLCRRCHIAKTTREAMASRPPEVRAWRQYVNRVLL